MNLEAFTRHLSSVALLLGHPRPDCFATSRKVRAALSAGVNVCSKASALLLTVLVAKSSFEYLGQERFGILMTIVSLSSLLSILDLGLGNALSNETTKSFADSSQVTRRVVTTGLLAIGAVATLGLAILLPLVLIAPVNWLSGTPELGREIRYALAVFVVLLCLSVFTTGIQRVFSGLQRGYVIHLTALTGNVLAGIATLVAARYRAPIGVLVGCTFGVQTVAFLPLILFLKNEGLLSKRPFTFGDLKIIRNLARPSCVFFLLQVGTLGSTGADSLIVTTTSGAVATAVFALAQRIFQVASQPFIVMNAPLWPAYADALIRGDAAFVRTTLRRALVITFIGSAVLSLGLASFAPALYGFMTNSGVTVPDGLLWAFALWTIVEATAGCFSMFVNASGLLTPQLAAYALALLIGLPLKIALAEAYGPAAMLSAFAAVYGACFLVCYALIFRKRIAVLLQGM